MDWGAAEPDDQLLENALTSEAPSPVPGVFVGELRVRLEGVWGAIVTPPEIQ